MSKNIKYAWYPQYNAYITKNQWNAPQSYNDEPSFIEPHTMMHYYSYHWNNLWHRDDAPAVIYYDESRLLWFNNGVRYEPKCQKL